MITQFDFSTIQPAQVLALFQQYLKESNSALDILLTNGQNYQAGNVNKYEWLESQLSPLSWEVNASSLAGAFDTAATMTFDSTTGLKANMVLRFVASTGVDKGDMQVHVNSVDSATTATVVIYGGTTGVALDNTCTAKLINELVPEGEKNIAGDTSWIPTREYNYFQIFRNSAELSNTALNSAVFGNVNQLEQQLKNVFYKVRQSMAEQVIRGRRVARDATVKGSFGGILPYIKGAGGNAVAAGGNALTPTYINNLMELIVADGGMVNTIVCNIKQARKISAFNRNGGTGANVYTMIDNAVKDVGNYALRFISDIPLMDGMISNIMIDEKMPIDEIALVDINGLALVPFEERGLRLVDGTQNGDDAITGILRGEYTLVHKDAKYSAGVITGLSVA